MKRGIVLSLMIVVGALSMAVAGARQAGGQPEPKVIEVQKLKDNVYVLTGGGGNVSAFITSTGVVVVDAKNPGWGQTLLDKIKTLTDKPVTVLVSTHAHGDHVGGNPEFPATVDIVAQVNTKTYMEKMVPHSAQADQTVPAQTIFQENKGKGMPTKTFTDKMSIGSGNDRVDLFFFGRGHTGGDAWVLFPSQQILHAGDIFSGKNIPLIDYNNGGSAAEYGNTLQKAHDAFPAVTAIVTGHSTDDTSKRLMWPATLTRADLNEYAAFNREFLADVRAAKKAGKTVEQVVSAWTMPAKYAGYAPPRPERLINNVRAVFNETK